MTTTASIQYSHTVGSLSNQGRGFQNPVDVALDSQGLMYVVSRAGPEVPLRMPYKRISICTVDEEFLGEFGTGGTATGEFWWPSSLAFDSCDRLYLADEALNRITVYSTTGEVLDVWGEAGASPGQLQRPSGLAFDGDDNLLITDSGNNRIQKFAVDGRFLQQWGKPGCQEGEFDVPWGIDVDTEGNIFVSDWGNDRVQKFSSDGNFLKQFTGPSSMSQDSERINRPAGVSVDQEGRICVADWGNERVRVLSPEGDLIATLRGESETPTWADEYFLANPEEGALRQQSDLAPALEPSRGYQSVSDREESANIERLFWGPTAVKPDGHGNLLVVDSCRHRIQVYRWDGQTG